MLIIYICDNKVLKSINLCKAPQVTTLKSLQAKVDYYDIYCSAFNFKMKCYNICLSLMYFVYGCFHVYNFRNMPNKFVSIPAIPNFANLVVYPSKQEVSYSLTILSFL